MTSDTPKVLSNIDDTRNELRSQKRCSGFVVLYDIIGSTTIKKSQDGKTLVNGIKNKDWRDSFRKVYTELGNKISDFRLDENRLDGCELIFTKYIGDAVLAFFQSTAYNEIPSKNDASLIFKFLTSISQSINHDNKNLEGIELRTIICWLRDIHIYRPSGSPQGIDILGRGVDFTFKIGKICR